MNFTPEQLAKAKAAKTAEELCALAKAEGIEATEEQIKSRFAAMHKEGEVADKELDNVAGGLCEEEEPPAPNFRPGEIVMLRDPVLGHIQVIIRENLKYGWGGWWVKIFRIDQKCDDEVWEGCMYRM